MEEYLITQAIFRKLLEVMSRPGTVQALPSRLFSISPDPLVAIGATLMDQETVYWVFDDEQLDLAVRLKTKARSALLEEADFIFISGGSSDGRIIHARRGTLNYPDTGATVIYQVQSLEEDSPTPTAELTGPGIAVKATPSIGGLDGDDLAMLSTINQEYPLGIDVILVDSRRQVMALPRSTRIRMCNR